MDEVKIYDHVLAAEEKRCITKENKGAQVQMEGKICLSKKNFKIPTYEVGKDYEEPAFCEHGVNNWSIYPYTYQWNLTRRKVLKTYKALVLENKYLKITVLPELGGRIYSVFDKVKNTEMFYNPNAIKPALIALRGAWICGGIEFNTGHPGHSVNTMSPVNYYTDIAKDSASITVGDIEYNFRTEWSVRISLHRNEPFFETEIKIHNPNPYPLPCYFWSNSSLPYSDSLQLFFASRRIISSQGIFKYPLNKGVDISWIRNQHFPTDLFAHNLEKNWFGVYDHSKNYGVVHIASKKKCHGRKIFTWGRTDEEKLWKELLSEDLTTYIEMQSGLFETQSKVGLIKPRQTIEWKETWYPFWSAPANIKEKMLNYYIEKKKLKTKNTIPPKTSFSYFERGIAQYRFGNDENAVGFFKKSIRSSSDVLKSRLWLGIIYYKKGLFSKAERLFKAIPKKDAENKEAKYYLGLIKGRKKFPRRFLWCDSGTFSMPHRSSSLNFYLELAARHITRKRYDRAKKILLESLDKCKNNPMIYYYLGFCTKNEKEARKYYALAGKLNQEYVFPHRTEEIEVLKKALEHNPRDFHARYYLGNLLYYKGRFDEAIKEWCRSLKLGNNYPILHRNLGFAYWKAENNLRLAQKYYERAISLNPCNVKTYLELEEIYRSLKDFNSALRMFGKMPDSIKKNEYLRKRLAELYINMKKPERAIQLLTATKFYFPYEGEKVITNLLQQAQFNRLLIALKME